MALYPPAIKKLIPPGPTDPRIDVIVGTIAHVAVSMADSLYDWFDGPSGGVESHFYIRLSGVVEQYRDTSYEADAQGAGNSWTVGGKRYGFISYETEGMGSGQWSAAQLASIKALILWGKSVHRYPMVKATSLHGPGHGYHALFDAWNPNGHSCPGPDRIRQFNNVLAPWLATSGNEDVVTPDDIKAIAAAVWATKVPRTNNPPVAAGTALGEGSINIWRAIQRLKALEPSDLAAAVTAGIQAAGSTTDVDALAKAIVLELGKD